MDEFVSLWSSLVNSITWWGWSALVSSPCMPFRWIRMLSGTPRVCQPRGGWTLAVGWVLVYECLWWQVLPPSLLGKGRCGTWSLAPSLCRGGLNPKSWDSSKHSSLLFLVGVVLLPWTRWCSGALSLWAIGQLVPALWWDVGNGVPTESVVYWLSPSKDSPLPPVHTLSPLPPWMLLSLPGMWVIVGSGVHGYMFRCACWPIPVVARGGFDLLNVEEGAARCRVVLWRLFLICTRVAVSGGVDCLLSLVF